MKEYMEMSDTACHKSFVEKLDHFTSNGWKVIGYNVVKIQDDIFRSYVLLERQVQQTVPKG